MDDKPKMKGPVKDFLTGQAPPKPGKGPSKPGPEDFRVGDFRCLRCGAALPTREELDRHTEKGHKVET